MPKPKFIELADTRIDILYEDRAVIAIDKPAGWILAPDSWDRTGRNLQLAIISSIGAGDFWARSRSIRYLRFVHRLDGDTSGVLLMAKSPGALQTYSDLFRDRAIEKIYLAVVEGVPKQPQWTCNLRLGPDSSQIGRHKIDPRKGKEATTHFQLIRSNSTGKHSLIEARPVTGRTHQIRIHLQAAGHPIVGDRFYAYPGAAKNERNMDVELGLRAVSVEYKDPFNRRPIRIEAPIIEFVHKFGF